jgi:hypothetical protein
MDIPNNHIAGDLPDEPSFDCEYCDKNYPADDMSTEKCVCKDCFKANFCPNCEVELEEGICPDPGDNGCYYSWEYML